PNIALMGRATQSSLHDINGVAAHAVDGNKNPNYEGLSCGHTQADFGPWWRLDLQEQHTIITVVITNREDCCSERLRGVQVWVGDSLEKGGHDNFHCGLQSSRFPSNDLVRFCCYGTVGRYVTVLIPNRTEFLTLCEVEVFGSVPLMHSDSVQSREYGGGSPNSPTEKNVTLTSGVMQSSLYHVDGIPERAIDGNRDSHYSSLSCLYTQKEWEPWFRVDLLQVHKVSAVTVTNRGDCCWDHLKGAEIHIGNSLKMNGLKNPMCGKIYITAPGYTESFCCNGMEGRFVTINIPGRQEFLTLCEVEVFGVPIPCPELLSEFYILTKSHNYFLKDIPQYFFLLFQITEHRDYSHPKICLRTPINMALTGTATQSSTYEKIGSPDRAIDGNSNSNYRKHPCTHTKRDRNPWWRVDLKDSRTVVTVVLTTRSDCCTSRIKGIQVRVGDSLENEGRSNFHCARFLLVLCCEGAMFFCCNGATGRYVTVFLPNTRNFLSLCEVEVFGYGASGNHESKRAPPTGWFIKCINALLHINHTWLHGEKYSKNIARISEVIQSSVYNKDGIPEHAIDGRNDNKYSSLSCLLTQKQWEPWFLVDLLMVHKVSSVSITNRGDYCWKRLKGGQIHVGNSLKENGLENPMCAKIEKVAQGNTEAYCCNGMKGRFVTINIPRREEILTFCEVDVLGVPSTCNQMHGEKYSFLDFQKTFQWQKNIARISEVIQSSVYNKDGIPEHAIDGRNDNKYSSLSCLLTQKQWEPWFMVDLLMVHKVSSVSITNRGDYCWKRLKGGQIHVGNSLKKNGLKNPMCAKIEKVAQGNMEAYCCNGMKGRFVTINIPGREEILTFCEVEVLGVP
uniref:Fucolectin tachylectin-4 pentraxin-1 domain-containing protein n=1 Tax=Latimeria chalumnae TaxID=7897 RepID=H3AI33_LATCH